MKIIVLLLFVLFYGPLHAASISYLKGNSYKSYGEEVFAKDIITIDHYGTWKYGSVYFFYDISRAVKKDDHSDFFGSISPMFSLSKMTGKDFSNSWLHDVDVKFELEHVSGYTPVYYYGFNLPIKLPYFRNFSVAPVLRDDPLKKGVGGQVLLAWGLPLHLNAKLDFMFSGFLAMSMIAEDKDEFFMITQPQFLVDIGQLFKTDKNQFFAGMEYSYAINRYLKKGTPKPGGGVESGFDENVLQAMVKLVY
ncbi:MAG: hypothetical protein H6625_03395 [Bdellovibrionaceae bacterium]|nr:hypothetical protein [Pseudobdellovibrionaceae bacterium]